MTKWDVYLPNGFGSRFEDEIVKLSMEMEFWRREEKTFIRRTVHSWVVYSFLMKGTDQKKMIASTVKRVAERSSIEYRIYESISNPVKVVDDESDKEFGLKIIVNPTSSLKD